MTAPITQPTPELQEAQRKVTAAWDYHQELIVSIFYDLEFDIQQRAQDILEAAETARELEREYKRMYQERYGEKP